MNHFKKAKNKLATVLETHNENKHISQEELVARTRSAAALLEDWEFTV